uniref:glycosyltransferase family 2 protein n=1 Tax=Claveliimonas sp. TaxID=3076672 RepID=UPI00307C002E
MEIVLSVIIPMFKGKKYIKSTVEQVKKIKINKEIIIVNDGSPDDSYDYCSKLYDLDDEVILINKENGGIASARNVGLENTHGRYVLFIDQDDCINPISVKNSIDYMLNSDLDIIFWSTEFRNVKGETSICDEVYQEGILTREQIVDEVMTSFIMSRRNKYISYLGHIWGGIISKRIIENNNLSFRFFIDYEDDYLFVFDCLLVAHKIGFIKNTGYYWTVNEKSYSHCKRLNCNYIDKSERMY